MRASPYFHTSRAERPISKPNRECQFYGESNADIHTSFHISAFTVSDSPMAIISSPAMISD
jgi:hypothetical protein